jgi:flagellar biosynthetic protein FliQ
MNEADVGALLHAALIVTLKLAGPPLVVSLLVGTVAALIQAVTQINESAVAYVPKALALFAALALLGPFYHATLTQYATLVFDRMMTLGWH